MDPARICYPFVGDSVGGAQLSVELLAAGLDRTRFEPVLVLHQDGPLADHLRTLGTEFRLLPLVRYVGRGSPAGHLRDVVSTLPSLVGFLRREGIDLVHANDARMNLTWALPARLAGPRFIWHQRSWFPDSGLARAFVRLADDVVCISDFARRTVPITASARVIPNPFRVAEQPSSARSQLLSELGLPASTQIVGWFGRITAQKRPKVFVDAAARILSGRSPDVVFPMFGRGAPESMEQLRAHIAVITDPTRVPLMGFRHPVEPWMAACDAILVPAVGDAFGRTLVEASISGTPVVASRSGGHPEIIEHEVTGLLVPPDDSEALARACSRLLEDPELRKVLVGRAWEVARTRYSAASHVAAVQRLYTDLLS